MSGNGFGIKTSQGLSELFRNLQRAEQEVFERDRALSLAFQFWFVVREISDHGPSAELLRKLDSAERDFLESVERLGWTKENWVVAQIVGGQ